MKYLAQISFFHDYEIKRGYSLSLDIFHSKDTFLLPEDPTNFIIFDAENESQAKKILKKKIIKFLKDGSRYFINKDNLLNCLAKESMMLESEHYSNDFNFNFDYVLSGTEAFFDYEKFKDKILDVDGVSEKIIDYENDFLDLTDAEINSIELSKINNNYWFYYFAGHNYVMTKFMDGKDNICSDTDFEFSFLLIPVSEITGEFKSETLIDTDYAEYFNYFLKTYNAENNLNNFICFFVNKIYINDIGEQVLDIQKREILTGKDAKFKFEIENLLKTSLKEYIKNF